MRRRRILILSGHQLQRLRDGEDADNDDNQVETRIQIFDIERVAVDPLQRLPADKRDHETEAEQQCGNHHGSPVRNDQQHGAEKRRHENVALAEQGAKVAKIGAEQDQRAERDKDREAAAKERGGIGERQRPCRLAPLCHRMAVIGCERVDRRARRVDQDRRNGPAIHARPVNPEQQDQRHQIVEEHRRRQKNGDGDGRADAGNGADHQTADGPDHQRHRHLRLGNVGQSLEKGVHALHRLRTRFS